MRKRRRSQLFSAACAAVAFGAACSHALAQLTGQINAHDPSTLIKSGTTSYYYSTGQGILSRYSTDRVNWTAGPAVFGTPPAWTSAVPGFAGDFWAPDVVFRNGQYYLYYSVSTFGSQVSGIGVARSPTLDPTAANYGWVDRGPVIQSFNGSAYNTIDPSILQDGDGRMYMTFGSYWNGIYVTELNPTTGLRLNASVAPTQLARNPGNTSIEASSLIKHGSFYYLFVNYDQCCSGIDSTYNIRVGRGTSPTGPFFDKNGVNMVNGGGSTFLDDDGAKIGPGHFGIISDGAQEQFSFHYYDGNRHGAPTYGIDNLYWSPSAWPSIGAVDADWSGAANANWSAAGNWSDGVVPDGVSHVANFGALNNGRYAVAVDGGPRTVSRINFRGDASFTIGTAGGNGLTLDAMNTDAAATINVSAGSHAIAAPIAAPDGLAVNVTPAASVLTLSGGVSGARLAKYGYGELSLGGTQAYAGTVLAYNGTVRIASGSVTAGQYIAVGPGAGDVATLSVQGLGALTANSDLNVGDTGSTSTAATGTLVLRDFATITIGPAGGLFVGSGFNANSKADGTFNQIGGTLVVNSNFDGGFVIGGRTSARATGVYNLSGGAATGNNTVQIGRYGTGTVNQTGGTFTANSYLSIGRYAGGVGTWNLTAGTLNAANAATLLIVGEGGAGMLTIGGAGIASAAGGVRLGLNGGSTGTVNLNAGGTLTTTTISKGSGSASFNFDGGTLRASNDQTNFFQLTATQSEIKSGGARIDTNGHAVAIVNALDGPGGLTKLGAGTLTLAADQAFTGGVAVSNGTLAVTRLAGNGGVNITGGTLALAAPATPFDPAHRSVVPSLAISGGTLDIGQNAFVVDYADGAPSPIDAIRLALAASRITAGPPASGYAVGYAEASSLATVPAAFGAVDGSALLVRLTLAGDTNLDASVGFDDLLALAQQYDPAAAGKTWQQGDFTYDGTVDFDDLLVLAQNYGANFAADARSIVAISTAAGPAFAADWALAQALVPEPTLGVLAGVAALGMVGRRRTA